MKQDERRAFLKKTAAIVCGLVSGLVPTLAGLTMLLDPLRRQAGASKGLVKVASLPALSGDDQPRKFTVIGAHTDSWDKSPAVSLGAVYLRRTGSGSVEALNAVCPHAGCFVDYLPGERAYLCPCHRSTFKIDGQIKDAKSPAPRGLDALAVEIRNGNEIWIKFQNFVAGRKEKTPLA